MSAGLAQTRRQLRPSAPPSAQPAGAPQLDFTDMVWLFQCNNNNRGIARLNLDEAALLWNTVKATEGPTLEIVNADPGSILTGRQREFCRTWANQQEVTVKGLHFIQEDSPHEIGKAALKFLSSV